MFTLHSNDEKGKERTVFHLFGQLNDEKLSEMMRKNENEKMNLSLSLKVSDQIHSHLKPSQVFDIFDCCILLKQQNCCYKFLHTQNSQLIRCRKRD